MAQVVGFGESARQKWMAGTSKANAALFMNRPQSTINDQVSVKGRLVTMIAFVKNRIL